MNAKELLTEVVKITAWAGCSFSVLQGRADAATFCMAVLIYLKVNKP